MEFRELTPELLEDVLAMESLCFSIPWSREAFAGKIGNPRSLFYLAYEGPKPIGFVAMDIAFDVGDITKVAVHPEFQGRGYSHVLLAGLLEEAKKRNVTSLLLEVRASNQVAIHLYLAHGFKEIGRRKKYYRAPVEDGIVMAKKL